MQSPKSIFMAPLIVIMVIMTLMSHETSYAAENSTDNSHLCSSSCGHIHDIRAPFRLTTDPLKCGDLRYNLSCENNHTVLYLYVIEYNEYQRYYVEAINYDNYTIRLVDPNINDNHDCSSLPSNSLNHRAYITNNVRFDSFNWVQYRAAIWSGLSYFSKRGSLEWEFKKTRQLLETLVFFNCESPVENHNYTDAAPCKFKAASSTSFSLGRQRYYSYYYVVDNFEISSSEFEKSCWIERTTVIRNRETYEINASNYDDIHKQLVYGFELSWIQSFTKRGSSSICYFVDEASSSVQCFSVCSFKDDRVNIYGCDLASKILGYLEFYLYILGGYKYIVGMLATRTTFGVLFLIVLLTYKWKKQHLSMYEGIEEFLQSQNNLMPIRYTYGDIKKMTKGFQTKLGEGGFGTVYKGKLRSGQFVAVKILGKSKTTNGQDFINEVASIGRIHHINVVRLVGFCVEGSKRALIYDFMPNGSLDKYIFSREEPINSLSLKELFEVSLGIARGIGYLHGGCDIQILHFDIKPYNILLDDNFIPKISDFGLARLCPLDNNEVSLTAARGTIGYIAPELFYKNIGGVSYKADVYSFGMLLMEMANRRKNVNASAEKSSQIYFPLWIYDQFSIGNDIEIEDATEAELKIVKKMMIVALWCIQLKPCDRPSMNKVLEMLEDEVECLQMPPKPCLYPENNHNVEDSGEPSELTRSSALSDEEDPTDEISLISNAM